MSLKGKSLVSITDYNKNDWLAILKLAAQFETKQPRKLLTGKVIASLFFEPSTRTRLSFESATQKLGGSIIGFSGTDGTSISKGESLKDTIRMASGYSDLIIMRHPLEGSAKLATEFSSVPIINGGDGTNQHPTQTLVDLYAIQKTQKALSDLTITFVGDLIYGRTVHSLTQALKEFGNHFIFVSPKELAIPQELKAELDAHKVSYQETESLPDAISKSDVLYMTRIQRERFADPLDYERVKNSYILQAKLLENTKPNLKVMHPLPRVDEISESVDADKRAFYFEQAQGGLYVRQALIAKILGVVR